MYVYELRQKDIKYFVNWDITIKSEKYVCRSPKWDLCICQKLVIARADLNVLLNKRDELVSKCRQRNKLTLKCFKEDNLYYSVYVTIIVFFLLGKNVAGNYLMIGDMKHSRIMVIWLSDDVVNYIPNDFSVSLRMQSYCGKMQTRITPNTDTFHTVQVLDIFRKSSLIALEIS